MSKAGALLLNIYLSAGNLNEIVIVIVFVGTLGGRRDLIILPRVRGLCIDECNRNTSLVQSPSGFYRCMSENFS